MGRRRKKVLRVNKRSLPTVFSCPKCGVMAVRITSHEDDASHDYITVVACGNAACQGSPGNKPLRKEFRFENKRPDIDVYNMFVDDFVKNSV